MLRDEALNLLLSGGGSVVIPIVDGDSSMAPLLRGGDAVLAAPIEAAGPRRGEIVLFRQHDYLVVHRYLGPATTREGAPRLRTRGDGRNRLDPPLAPGDLRGRAIAVRRAGAWRSLEGPGARLFRRAMAWHALFWAATGVVAGRAGLGAAVAALDFRLLAATAPWTFALLHGRLPEPAAHGSVKTG